MANEMNYKTTSENLKREALVLNSFEPCFKINFFNRILLNLILFSLNLTELIKVFS